MRAITLAAALCLPLVAPVLVAAPALADTVSMNVALSPEKQVPPVEAPGASGQFQGEFDTETSVLTYSMTLEGLTGAPTAAHLHGPAGPDENAGVMVPLELDGGEVELNDEQTSALNDGLIYVNVHTEANPNGEVRGQLVSE